MTAGTRHLTCFWSLLTFGIPLPRLAGSAGFRVEYLLDWLLHRYTEYMPAATYTVLGSLRATRPTTKRNAIRPFPSIHDTALLLTLPSRLLMHESPRGLYLPSDAHPDGEPLVYDPWGGGAPCQVHQFAPPLQKPHFTGCSVYRSPCEPPGTITWFPASGRHAPGLPRTVAHAPTLTLQDPTRDYTRINR